MTTYFAARRAEIAFRQYRELTLLYWDAVDGAFGGAPSIFDAKEVGQTPHGEAAADVRATLNEMYPEVVSHANLLRVPIDLTSYPPISAAGRPPIQSNFLYHAFDPQVGSTGLYGKVPRQQVLDVINNCIGASRTVQGQLFWRQALNPFWYLIRLVAFIIRIPFLILEEAGIPKSVENTIWGHLVKGLLLTFVLGLCTYFGIKLTGEDVLKLVK